MSDQKLDASKEAQRFTSTSQPDKYKYTIEDTNDLDLFYNDISSSAEAAGQAIDFCISKNISNGKINLTRAKNCVTKMKKFQSFLASNAYNF